MPKWGSSRITEGTRERDEQGFYDERRPVAVGVNVSNYEDWMAVVVDSHQVFAVVNIDILIGWHLYKHSQFQAVNKQLSYVFNSYNSCLA